MTIELEREHLQNALKRGESVECPCCNQTAKIYARKISAVMAVQLIQLNNSDKPVHYKNLRNKGGGDADYSKLQYWGLAEQWDKFPGYWKITDKGIEFVYDCISIPDKAFVFNGSVVGFSDVLVSIKDCLKVKFDYGDLMASAPVRVWADTKQPSLF